MQRKTLSQASRKDLLSIANTLANLAEAIVLLAEREAAGVGDESLSKSPREIARALKKNRRMSEEEVKRYALSLPMNVTPPNVGLKPQARYLTELTGETVDVEGFESNRESVNDPGVDR